MLGTSQNLDTHSLEIKPTKAIIFYSVSDRGRGFSHQANSRTVSPTVHEFKPSNDGKFEMTSGVPVSKEDIRSIDESFAALASTANNEESRLNKVSKVSSADLLSEQILISKANTLAWLSKSKSRTLWFRNAKPVNAIVPNLLFVAHKGQLYILAIKDDFATLDSELFYAPLMNIYNSHKLCFGNATNPNRYSINAIGQWESALFDAQFTHTNHDKTIKIPNHPTVSNAKHIKFWKEREGKKQFKYSALKPAKLTVKSLLDSLD